MARSLFPPPELRPPKHNGRADALLLAYRAEGRARRRLPDGAQARIQVNAAPGATSTADDEALGGYKEFVEVV